jgi:transcriptional regulator with GAF, ATPase, and Fis domain
VHHNFEEIISQGKALKKVLQKVEQVASTDASVLVLGETGTGKELLARAVHNISERSERPLVKVNCAAIPVNLVESELFGHEKGAFTGALSRKIGRFELANGGTIFLDEIGDLSLDLQSKLLRVLQEGEFERLGNPHVIKVDVRIIAATHRNLEKAIEEGEFREDLYYRLNVFPIEIPPLRERKDDIPLLVKHFVKKYSGKTGKKIDTIPQKAIDALTAYKWPGNIRELENIVERAVIISRGKQLELGDWLIEKKSITTASHAVSLQDVERAHISEVLEMTGWRVSGEKGAAKILGLKPTTLEARMNKLGIKRSK